MSIGRRHQEAGVSFLVRPRGCWLEAGVQAFGLLFGVAAFVPGGPCPRGPRDDQGPFDRPAVGVHNASGDEVAIWQFVRLKSLRCPQGREVSVDEGHDGVGRGRRRRGPDLEPVGPGNRRLEQEAAVRTGVCAVHGGRQGVVAQQIEVEFESARIGPENDLDAGRGSAVFVDERAGDGERRHGRLGAKSAGGEPGQAR